MTGFHARTPDELARTLLRARRRPGAARRGRRAGARARRRGALLDGGARAALAGGAGVKVAWLADAFELAGRRRADRRRSSAPRRRRGVESSTARPARWSALAGCDVACVHNSVTYPAETVEALAGKPVLRYWHDLARPGSAGRPAADPLGARARDERLHLAAAPRPLPARASPGERASDPARDRPRALTRAQARKRPRGACWLGSGQHAGQGAAAGVRVGRGATSRSTSGGTLAVAETAARRASRARSRTTTCRRSCGSTERFVFLPTHPEPFGRAVVEAWAAGCELIVNRNVGALHWLEHPDALERAAARLLAAGRELAL